MALKTSGSRSARVLVKNTGIVLMALLLSSSGHLGDAALMPPAFDVGCKEGLQAIARHLRPHQPGTECQHVGVVVQAAEAGAGGVVAEGGTDVAVTVGGNRNSDAGAADKDAAVRAAVGERRGQG